MIGLDFACLTRIENTLYGHFDMGVRSSRMDDPIEKRIKIDCMINCLFEHQMGDFFSDGKFAVTEIDYIRFLEISGHNIQFNGNTYDNFISLTKGCEISKFLVMPWMAEFQDKIRLYKEYFNLKL